MHRKTTWILSIVLLVALAPVVRAESHEEAPQPPSLFFIWTDHVPMAHAGAYEAEVPKMMSALGETEAGKELEFFALSGDGQYSYVIPLADMAAFSAINQKMMAAINEAGGLEAWDTVSELVDHGSGNLIVLRRDLSYYPAEPSETETTGQFRHHEWWYVRPGHEPGIEEVAKKFAALYEEKGVDSGFRIYQAITGDDLPLYVVSFRAADAADYHANEAKVNGMLGEAAAMLLQEAASHARRLERSNARMRPDLSMGGM